MFIIYDDTLKLELDLFLNLSAHYPLLLNTTEYVILYILVV